MIRAGSKAGVDGRPLIWLGVMPGNLRRLLCSVSGMSWDSSRDVTPAS
jgi:hypothetical protein